MKVSRRESRLGSDTGYGASRTFSASEARSFRRETSAPLNIVKSLPRRNSNLAKKRGGCRRISCSDVGGFLRRMFEVTTLIQFDAGGHIES